MNNDIYLNFLYRLISTNQIEERTKIVKFYNNKEIDEKNIEKKLTNVIKSIVKVKLENNKYLLIDDIPINFFLSHTIIVGKKSELVEFENENNEVFICEREIYIKLKNSSIFKINKLKNFNPTDLYNLKYEFEFEIIEIINEIKKFSKEINKLDLNKIHIVDSNKVENFIPTIKNSHFKIAKKMHLPIISLIENNFIKKSIINIKETNSIIEKINPILNSDEKILWDYLKNTDNKLFKDIEKEVIIKVDSDKLIEKIENAAKLNFNFDIILKDIFNKKEIVLSDSFSKIPLPLFKSHNEQKFLEIKDTNEFLEISGRNFKLDEKFLNNLFIQSLSGEETIYKNYFLNEKIKNILENIDINNNENKIEYLNSNEFIIKLILKDRLDEIKKLEKINKKLILEIKKSLKFIIKKTILLSIKFNKLPINTDANSEIKKYYQSVANTLNLEFEKYKNKPSKKELLSKTIKKINNINIVLKNFEFEFEHLYFYNQISLILINILFEFDEKNSTEIKNLFYEYFKEDKFQIKKNSIDKDLEEIIEGIALANKISKKKKIYISKNKEFNFELLSKKVEILNINPSKKNLKPNINEFKNIFPYSYKQVIEKIKNMPIEEIKNGIKINNKIIRLEEDFFRIHKYYNDYKIIYENQFFLLAIKKPESISKISV